MQQIATPRAACRRWNTSSQRRGDLEAALDMVVCSRISLRIRRLLLDLRTHFRHFPASASPVRSRSFAVQSAIRRGRPATAFSVDGSPTMTAAASIASRRTGAGARLRLAVRPAHRPPRPRAERLLRDRPPRHHAPSRSAETAAARADPLRRPGQRLRAGAPQCDPAIFRPGHSGPRHLLRHAAGLPGAGRQGRSRRQPASSAGPAATSRRPTACSPACPTRSTSG